MDRKELLENYKKQLISTGCSEDLSSYLTHLAGQALSSIDTLNKFTTVHFVVNLDF